MFKKIFIVLFFLLLPHQSVFSKGVDDLIGKTIKVYYESGHQCDYSVFIWGEISSNCIEDIRQYKINEQKNYTLLQWDSKDSEHKQAIFFDHNDKFSFAELENVEGAKWNVWKPVAMINEINFSKSNAEILKKKKIWDYLITLIADVSTMPESKITISPQECAENMWAPIKKDFLIFKPSSNGIDMVEELSVNLDQLKKSTFAFFGMIKTSAGQTAFGEKLGKLMLDENDTYVPKIFEKYGMDLESLNFIVGSYFGFNFFCGEK